MSLSVIILAAGRGERMRSSTPKVLHHLAGIPILQRILATVAQLHPEQIIVIHGHKGLEVQNYISDAMPKLQITWVQQQHQRGTGHAVQCSLPHIKPEITHTLVLCGDVPLISLNTLQQFISNTQTLGLITNKVEDPAGLGRIIRDENNKIINIIEEKDATNSEKQIREINTGIILFPQQYLLNNIDKINSENAAQEFYLTDLITIAVQQNITITSTHPQYHWETTGINNKVDLAVLERIWQKYTIKQLMLQHGVTCLDPNRVDIRGNLTVGSDVSIDLNVIFTGSVKLGNNVTIGANCYLENVTIGDNVIIKANSVLEEAIIDNNCTVGPFARLRPGSKLYHGAKIGNFVEIKNSTIGTKSKVNHLSYVGDTTIGANVNFGAGSITCNYDGVNKYKTTIEDGAFVGSNSTLIAPITIGNSATIGAGTVVTKDAPAKKLTIGRVKQKTIENWQRPTKQEH